jgi:transcriptional regulator with GAF, ATPase, and Fis domain
VPADSGAILLASANRQGFVSSSVSRQRFPTEDGVRVSNTIALRVLNSGQAILIDDVQNQTSSDNRRDSLIISGAHSVLCVPLSVARTPIGVLYLNAIRPDVRFDQRHLELTTAIASTASVALERLRYVEWLESENEHLSNEITSRTDMIGQSPKMQEIYKKIEVLARHDRGVLILGESGTGKELVAKALHHDSDRRTGPFVPINCGAIAETLFMTEMFGHVKGAFSSADQDRKGFIEQADGGTLFLDEIAEIPPNCQSALLRVLEDFTVIRVGSEQRKKVNFRLISATSREIKDSPGFRKDLYFRLGTQVVMPPLRERREDIPDLVHFFVDLFTKKAGRDLGRTHPDTIRYLQEYSWPGNVRELRDLIEEAVLFAKGDRIRPEDLPSYVTNTAMTAMVVPGPIDSAKESCERQLIIRALEETRGNVTEAAVILGRLPTNLQRRISKLGLRSTVSQIRTRR